MKNIHRSFACVLALAGALLVSDDAQAQRAGAISTETHDPGYDGQPWLPTIAGATLAAGDFLTNLGGTKVFQWTTSYGALHALEDATPFLQAEVEGLDILWMNGHGGAWSDMGFGIVGSRNQDRTFSDLWYLGNGSGGKGLRVLSLKSCNSLTPYIVTGGSPLPPPFPQDRLIEYDGTTRAVWERWQVAMAGGLKMVTGSWGTTQTSGTRTLAANYGTYLRNGQTVWSAWRQASFDAHSKNTPAVLVTGKNPTDCSNRLAGLKVSNWADETNFPYLRNAAIQASCWYAWW